MNFKIIVMSNTLNSGSTVAGRIAPQDGGRDSSEVGLFFLRPAVLVSATVQKYDIRWLSTSVLGRKHKQTHAKVVSWGVAPGKLILFHERRGKHGESSWEEGEINNLRFYPEKKGERE